MPELTHFDERGRARMVDVGAKPETERLARARGKVYMQPETLALIRAGGLAKGDVLGVAQTAGIMAAKRTAELIPMCHLLLLDEVGLDFRFDEEQSVVEIEARVRNHGRTGVEMEALTAVSVAALTIYDMCKAVDRGMVITEIRLAEKFGGKSGSYIREGERQWPKS
ncbi:MAG: cyclic pyranopterin monophosphate synthase MoaC [Thermacetogeniaceae bacterium]